ncbi:MAG: ribulose-phosphate 3-epimerase, partial [Chloroflexi bacterium]|nr:ribulose-phosphate 3-epimerase [Chloroflexota bacterium]
GQKFIESVLPKVQQLREMLDWRNSLAEIEVDGGIDAKTAPLAAKAGATAFVAATAVFQAGMTVDEAMAKLRKSLA